MLTKFCPLLNTYLRLVQIGEKIPLLLFKGENFLYTADEPQYTFKKLKQIFHFIEHSWLESDTGH